MLQKCRSEQQSRVSYPYCKSSSVRPIELEVNISIGRSRFTLQVEKCTNLHSEVQLFLKTHNINPKYETPILAMVREELAKKQAYQDAKDKYENKSQVDELKRVKSEVEQKKKIHYQQKYEEQAEWREQDHKLWYPHQNKSSHHGDSVKQNKQNYQSQFNSENQQLDFDNSIAPRRSKEKQPNQEETNCQNLYEKWKVKEKIKQTEKMKNNKDKSAKKTTGKQKQTQKSQHLSPSCSQKKVSSHSPDHFYNKGVRFNEAKEIHVEELYKQRYPFQLNRDSSLTPTKKTQLHERLFKEHRVKQVAKIEKEVSRVPIHKTSTAIDKYKQKVIQRDSKVNEALGYLLSHKLIDNPYKIQSVPKTPFRKTQAY